MPGLVRIWMRPKPRRSNSDENGLLFMRISRIELAGGHAAAGEAVYEDLTALGSRSGAGEGLERGLEVFGIVGESFEIFIRQHDRSGGGFRVGRDGGLVADRYGRFLDGDAESDVEGDGPAGRNGDLGIFVLSKTGLRDLQGVGAGGEVCEREAARIVSLGGAPAAVGGGEYGLGAEHQAALNIGYGAANGACVLPEN